MMNVYNLCNFNSVDMVDFLCCNWTVFLLMLFFFYQYAHLFFSGASFNSFSTQPVFMFGTALPEEQDLDFTAFHEACMGSTLEPVKVSQDGNLHSSVLTATLSFVSLTDLLRCI